MRKFFTYLVLGFIFCSVSFGGGYLLGMYSVPSQATDNNISTQTPSLESYNPEPIIDENGNNSKEQFLLKDENGVLTLYRISDEVTSIIKSIQFDSSFLPSDDRIKLEKGIYFDNIEEGFSLIEDFTS